MAITINKDICIACGCCIDACAQGALELNGKAVVDWDVCIDCLSCIAMCPVDAIEDAIT